MFHEHKDLGDRRSLRSLEGPQPNPNGFPLGNRFRRIEPVPVIAVATTQAQHLIGGCEVIQLHDFRLRRCRFFFAAKGIKALQDPHDPH